MIKRLLNRLRSIDALYWSLGLALLGILYHFSAIQADGYYYLDAGKRILGLKWLPERDLFSFNTGFTYWRIVEWLPDILFYSICRLLGEKALLALVAAIFSFVFYFFWARPRVSLGPMPTFIYSLVFLYFYHNLIIVRAELLMTLYFLFFHYCAILSKGSLKQKLLILIPIQILWANSHPSFVLPIFFLVIAALGAIGDYLSFKDENSLAAMKDSAALSVLLTFASFVNPYGVDIFGDVFFRITSFAYQGVDITQPLDFSTKKQWFIWIYLVLVTYITFRKRGETTLRLKMLLFAQLFMALLGIRYLIFIMISSLPLLVPYLGDLLSKGKVLVFTKRSFSHSRLLLSLAALLIGVYATVIPLRYRSLYSSIDSAVDYLDKSLLGENLFNPYEYGTYLTHRLYPQYKVFVDGRSYLYDPNLIYLDWKVIAYGPAEDKEKLLSCYPIDHIIWPAQDNLSLNIFLRSSRKWTEVWSDSSFAIYERRLKRSR